MNSPAYAAKHDLTQGPVGRQLIRMTLPMIWAMAATISFQLVDTWFVSRLGTAQLTAMTFTFPVTYGVFTLMMGLSIATSSVISRRIGGGDAAAARRITTHALLFGAVFGLLLGAAGLLLTDPLFRALGAPPGLLPLIRQFMVPWFAGAVFVNTPLVANAAVRASGNPAYPAIVMTGAALLNAALDPPLIYGLFGLPALGITGAAIATVSANALALGAGIYYLRARRNMLGGGLTGLGDSAKRLLVIALPVGLTTVLTPAVFGVLTSWLATVGTPFVAAYGIANRVEAFAFIAVIALSTGMGPVIGQNFGAGHVDRVRQTLRRAIAFAALWSLAVAVILGLAAAPIARLFTADPAIIAAAVLYFRIVPASYLFGNLVPGWSSAFNAMGLPKRAFVMAVTRQLLLILPLAWLGREFGGARGLFFGVALGNAAAGIAFHLISRRFCRNLGRHTGQSHAQASIETEETLAPA